MKDKEIPINSSFFSDNINPVVLIGFNDFQFGESRGEFYLENFMGGNNLVKNAKNIIRLSIWGDKSLIVGFAIIIQNKINLLISLDRFYTRSLYYQNLLLVSDDKNYFVELPKIQNGFNLSSYEKIKPILSVERIKKLSGDIQALVTNEICILNVDQKNKMITDDKAQKYIDWLSRLLANLN